MWGQTSTSISKKISVRQIERVKKLKFEEKNWVKKYLVPEEFEIQKIVDTKIDCRSQNILCPKEFWV